MSFDPVTSAEHWSRQNQKERDRLVLAVSLARQEAERLAQRLKVEAQVEAVYLFGSLAEGTVYQDNFDIDLAMVKGDYVTGLRLVRSCPFPVDLHEYESLPDPVKRRVDALGVRLV